MYVRILDVVYSMLHRRIHANSPPCIAIGPELTTFFPFQDKNTLSKINNLLIAWLCELNLFSPCI